MEKIQTESIYIKNLKGLHDIQIQFDKPLTAIMGVNGAGKTTVIHALACAYAPSGKGENHRFSDFFVPNSDSLWNGSEFSIVNKLDGIVQPSRTYCKKKDRWKPRYESRPKRNVYYLGIDTCLPEIEKNNTISRINYTSTYKTDNISEKTRKSASEVLNIAYQSLVDNTYNNKHFLGVSTQHGLKYSSLSMGTGEQRTIKIIEKAYSAEPYSLILIDEIDLLLHVCALIRLIQCLNKIAADRNLQIVFTTHSLEILSLGDFVGLQYIDIVHIPGGETKLQVYDKPNSDIVLGLSGQAERPIQIAVEDSFSQAIIKTIVRRHNMSSKVEFIKFGAATNAFTLIAGRILSNQSLDNVLVVLDGDVFRTDDEKTACLKKVLTGTEEGIEEKRQLALSHISQYDLQDGYCPEVFMHELLIHSGEDGEIVQVALRIQATTDTHYLIHRICEELQESDESIVSRIVPMIENDDRWKSYIQPIENWIIAHKDV